MPSPINFPRKDGGTSGKFHTCPKKIKITPNNFPTNLRQPEHPLTPKRKRCPESPPTTQIEKTPRMNCEEEKIHQKILIQPPQKHTGKLNFSKPRNPHPKLNQQEFVKIGNTLTLMKHRGLATTSRKSRKSTKISYPCQNPRNSNNFHPL